MNENNTDLSTMDIANLHPQPHSGESVALEGSLALRDCTEAEDAMLGKPEYDVKVVTLLGLGRIGFVQYTPGHGWCRVREDFLADDLMANAECREAHGQGEYATAEAAANGALSYLELLLSDWAQQ